MVGKMKLFLGLVIVVSMLAIETEPACACSCAPPGPPLEELASSTAVFTGKVVSITKPFGVFGSSADPVKVTIHVFTFWKSPVAQTITITTSRSGASCGYTFEKGSEYLVYAYGQENNLAVSLCSRTQPLVTAEEDLAVLGIGTAPDPGNSEWPAISSFFPIAVLIIAGTGMIALVIVVLAFAKRYSRSQE
jgi:hypothetical protein